MSQLTGSMPTPPEQPVDHAGVAVEHPRPGRRRHDQRQQPRHEEQRPQRRRQREVPLEEDGQRQPDGVLEDQRHQDEEHRVAERRPNCGVAEHLAVDCEPGERRIAVTNVARCSDAGSARRCGRAGRRRAPRGRPRAGPRTPPRPRAPARPPAAAGGKRVASPGSACTGAVTAGVLPMSTELLWLPEGGGQEETPARPGQLPAASNAEATASLSPAAFRAACSAVDSFPDAAV